MPRLQGRVDPDGAIITVGVELGEADATDLRSRSLPISPPFQTTALIDTGASRTTLHPMIGQTLGLIPADSRVSSRRDKPSKMSASTTCASRSGFFSR